MVDMFRTIMYSIIAAGKKCNNFIVGTQEKTTYSSPNKVQEAQTEQNTFTRRLKFWIGSSKPETREANNYSQHTSYRW